MKNKWKEREEVKNMNAVLPHASTLNKYTQWHQCNASKCNASKLEESQLNIILSLLFSWRRGSEKMYTILASIFSFSLAWNRTTGICIYRYMQVYTTLPLMSGHPVTGTQTLKNHYYPAFHIALIFHGITFNVRLHRD